MKVTKALVGKRVEIVWRDPCRFKAEGKAEFEQMRGTAALPRWTEVGILDDVTDDVVRIIHSQSANAVPEWIGTMMPADLIESITILEGKPSEANV